MPTVTPCTSFPYPVPSDPPDVAGDLQRLATAIDSYLCNLNTKAVGELFHFYDTGNGYPPGSLLCDGATFSPTTYPALNIHLGGNQLPDLRGRFLLGAGTNYPMLSRGGYTDAVLPEHTHSGAPHTHGMSHNHTATSAAADRDHTHVVPGHQHYMNHQHDSGVRAGYDMNIASRTGHTNAIFTDNGTALIFETRQSAIMQAQVGGPVYNTGWGRDYTDTQPNFNTWGISDNHLHGISVVGFNGATAGPSFTGNTGLPTGGPVAAINSVTGRNLPPYTAVAILIQAE